MEEHAQVDFPTMESVLCPALPVKRMRESGGYY